MAGHTNLEKRPETPLLEARGIVKKFGEFAANQDVGLAIQPGEKHALLGENGAGKSTLVKMMYGVMQPTSGRFFWNGAETVVKKPAEARDMGIGMVFQHFSVFDALTVVENIALALAPEPMRALSQRIEQVSESYGLAIDPRRAVHTLSVGEKQRVEIIRCLLQRNHLVHEAPLERLGRREPSVGEHQLLRAAQADQTRQEVARAAVRRQAGGGVGHRELRRFGGEHEVAADRDAEAGARRRPIDRDDERRVHSRETRGGRVKVGGELLEQRRQPLAFGSEGLEVAAGAEHLPRAREQHRAHGRVVVAADGDVHQFATEREIDRVGRVGSRERDGGDTAFDVQLEILVVHPSSSERAHAPR
jgi:ABC-type lipoprotein export system ATPase subunit